MDWLRIIDRILSVVVSEIRQIQAEENYKPKNGISKMPVVTHYTYDEGSYWVQVDPAWTDFTAEHIMTEPSVKRDRGLADNGTGRITFHSLKFSDGREWDCKNGWRIK